MDELTIAPADGQGSTRGAISRPVRRRSSGVANKPPVCLYLEVTNRCNLLCTTCPRTYAELEPPADMSWQLFTRIVDQVPEPGARRAARCRRADAGEESAAHGALPEGARRLRAVQHQRHGAEREERARADRRRPRRAARVARCVDAGVLHQGARQGLLPPHPEKREGFPRHAGARGSRQAARVGLAHGPQGDDRRAACLRAGGRRNRRQRGLPAAPGVLRPRYGRSGAARPGAVRAYERRRGAGTAKPRRGSPNRWA